MGTWLTAELIRGAPNSAATSIYVHNVTIANYPKVRAVLSGTAFETFLH